MSASLEAIRARLAAATPGPWEIDHYSMAGVMPKMFGEGKCAGCRSGQPILWEGRGDINGKMMQAHIHEAGNWKGSNVIVHRDGGEIESVVVTTDEYGELDESDADLIANAPSDLAYLEGLLEQVEDECWKHRQGRVLNILGDPGSIRATLAAHILAILKGTDNDD